MPANNQFRHQVYSRSEVPSNCQLLQPDVGPVELGDRFRELCQPALRQLKEQGVRKLLLVHGTLAGTDVTGLHREIRRISPAFGRRMGEVWKQTIDAFAQDWGNYTPAFARVIAEQADGLGIERFLWTSENHHLGRAEAALRLIVELSALPPDGRIMLWGHSHAGNVFALLTNLLGGDARARTRFFAALSPVKNRIDCWDQARGLLLGRSPSCVDPKRLDVVTFGTPVRYGWESHGYGRLLHITSHRPTGELPDYRVPFPPSATHVAKAEVGDYFQQLFIAGTNFVPSIYSPRKWQAERKLHRLVQGEVSSRKLWESLSHGCRIADEGMNLLVDYSASGDPDSASLAGHAIYTRVCWIPFHLGLVADHLQLNPIS